MTDTCGTEPYECCRCGKGAGVAWLGAYNVGPHRLCVECYRALVGEWGC